jgi:hypothetical protein
MCAQIKKNTRKYGVPTVDIHARQEKPSLRPVRNVTNTLTGGNVPEF